MAEEPPGPVGAVVAAADVGRTAAGSAAESTVAAVEAGARAGVAVGGVRVAKAVVAGRTGAARVDAGPVRVLRALLRP